MSNYNETMFGITQSWFFGAYLLALIVSIVSRHYWRLFGATIASLATVVAVAASEVNLHASIATNAIKIALLDVELPFGLEHFPICLFLGFAVCLFVCDSIATDVYGKTLIRKAIVASTLACVTVAVNMVLFLVFGHVVIAIPQFSRLCTIIMTLAVLAQFFFTLFCSVVDVIFAKIERFRFLYVLTFLATPLLYTYGAYVFYSKGLLTTVVNGFDSFIDPLTYSDLACAAVAIVIVLLVWVGMISVSAHYAQHAVLLVLTYIVSVVVPVVIVVTAIFQGRVLNCHRDLTDFLKSPSGIFSTVLLAACTFIICLLPVILGDSAYTAPAKESGKKVKME